MSIQLTVPTLQRTRVVSREHNEESAVQEARAQSIPKISISSRLVVPTVSRRVVVELKKKTDAKQWRGFNRHAARRGKSVTLMVTEHARVVVQPCLYCGAEEKISVDRARNNESYTRENSVPCCGPCNMAKRDSSIRAFVQRARAISKATRAFAELKRSNSI